MPRHRPIRCRNLLPFPNRQLEQSKVLDFRNVTKEQREQLVRALEQGNGLSLSGFLVPAPSALTYLRRSVGLIVGVAFVVTVFVLLGRFAAVLWPSVATVNVEYPTLYLSEFGGVLAFGAITVAIGIWKFSFAETSVVRRIYR